MKCPTNVELRISNALRVHNLKCRRSFLPDLMLPYSEPYSSLKTCGSHFVFLSCNNTNSLVLTVKHGEEDWKRMEYTILTDDEEFKKLVEGIVEEYIEEMYQYYVYA